MQINFWFLLIALGLVLDWKVDFFTILLHLRRLEAPLPPALADLIDPERQELIQDYVRSKASLGLAKSACFLAAVLAFWWLGGLPWLDQWVKSWAPGGIWAGMAFIGLIVLALQVLELPFDLYETFGIEERFGFNRASPALWLADRAKGALLAAVLGLPLLALLLWLFQSVPLAWLWGWGAVTVFSLLTVYVAPAWIFPLFNSFRPLEDGELKTAIQTLAEKCDYPLQDISVMDGSKRSTKANAFFTGFGNRKKIALFDTLIEKHPTDELVAVLAHEIGHDKKGHVPRALTLSFLVSGLLFFLLGAGLKHLPLYQAFGFHETSVAVGLVLCALLFVPVNRILSVAGNCVSRHSEYEADAYAARATGSPEPMIQALRKLSRDNLSHPTPHPAYVFLNYTHPPVASRIEALQRLKGE